LITGGAGFIGSHLVDALAARGNPVTILDDFSTGRRANVAHVGISGAAEVFKGSVLDAELVDALMNECDCCLHLASAVGVKLIVSNPLETMQRNVRGADVVISAAAQHRKRLLFASTSEVYGKNTGSALHEESDRILGSTFKGRWSYATAKSYGETLAHGYHREHGAENVVVRLFNTIGPRQQGMYGMVVPRLVRQALTGADLTVYGDGTQSRCFLHVQDAVDAILSLIEHDGAIGRVFNVGNPVPVTILELAERIIDRTGSESPIRLTPYHEAYEEGFEELGKRSPDTTALQQLTGWSPQRTLDQALDDVIAFQTAELSGELGRRLPSARRPPEPIRADGVATDGWESAAVAAG
jgi:UDP-glucose 4-epimerase